MWYKRNRKWQMIEDRKMWKRDGREKKKIFFKLNDKVW